MAFDFPNTPTIGERWPNPAIAGQPQYQWNGTEWTAAVFDPAGYVKRTGDSMTGALSLSGDPTQALHAVPKQYIDAQRQRISIAGIKSVDIQVPTNAVAVRLTGVIYPTTNNFITIAIQMSLVPGVFRTSTADYSFSGFRHRSITNNTVVDPNHFTAYQGMLIAPSHASDGLAIQFDGVVTLKRPNATCLFQGDFRAFISNTEGITHTFYYGLLQAAAGSQLNVLALRLLNTVGDNWAAESYLHVEWL